MESPVVMDHLFDRRCQDFKISRCQDVLFDRRREEEKIEYEKRNFKFKHSVQMVDGVVTLEYTREKTDAAYHERKEEAHDRSTSPHIGGGVPISMLRTESMNEKGVGDSILGRNGGAPASDNYRMNERLHTQSCSSLGNSQLVVRV